MEERICAICHTPFLTSHWTKKTCSEGCSIKLKYLKKQEANKVANEQYRTIKTKIIENKVAAAENKPVKTLSDWSREAAECNMDYGQYRAQIEVFGKTYEELKATAASRSTTVHAHASKGSHKVGDSGYGYKLA